MGDAGRRALTRSLNRVVVVLLFAAAVAAGVVLTPLGAPLRLVPSCALAAAPQPRYGPVAAADLPWQEVEPVELKALRLRHRAPRLVAAFFVGHAGADDSAVHNARTAARELAGTVLEAGRIWSFNRSLGPYDRRRGYRPGESYVGGRVVDTEGGGVCRVSSALYNAAVEAGVAVVERHPHSMPVPYLPPGRDAAVAYGGKDLRLRHDAAGAGAGGTDAGAEGGGALVVWAGADEQGVYVALYGRRQAPQVAWRQEVLARQPYPTRRVVDPGLPPGAERVRVPGAEGVTVRTWVERVHPDGRRDRIDLGTDRYWPLPRIVEVGPES